MATTSETSEHTQVTTTIRYDPVLLASQVPNDGFNDKFKYMSDFYLLAYHRDKIMNSAKHSNWPVDIVNLYSGEAGLQVLFARLLLHVHQDRKVEGSLQIRLTLTRDGKLDISSSSALKPGYLFPLTSFDQNNEPTIETGGSWYQRIPIQVLIQQMPASASTSTTSPSLNFDKAFSVQEKLVVSQYGEVLHGEFTTPYFLQNGVWVTPAFSGGAIDSVTRRYALEHGLCKEVIILQSSLRHGDECWLSDSVRGFFTGSIWLPSQLTTRALSTDQDDAPPIAMLPNTKGRVHNAPSLQRLWGPHSGREKIEIPKFEDDGKKEDDDDDDDEIVIILDSPKSDTKPSSSKRRNPFLSASPATRRSKRFQPGFVPQILADEDEESLPRDYEPVPNPEHGGSLHVRRTPQPY